MGEHFNWKRGNRGKKWAEVRAGASVFVCSLYVPSNQNILFEISSAVWSFLLGQHCWVAAIILLPRKRDSSFSSVTERHIMVLFRVVVLAHVMVLTLIIVCVMVHVTLLTCVSPCHGIRIICVGHCSQGLSAQRAWNTKSSKPEGSSAWSRTRRDHRLLVHNIKLWDAITIMSPNILFMLMMVMVIKTGTSKSIALFSQYNDR